MRIDLDDYKTKNYICKKCEWEGKGADLGLGETYMDSAIVELDCPKCFEVMGRGQGEITDSKVLQNYQRSKLRDQKKVFELGAEGGSIAIYSVRNNKTCTSWYYFEINDMGFEEEDIPPTHRKSEYSYTFMEALIRLKDDKPNFFRLYPLLINEDFQQDVISVLRLMKDNSGFKLDYKSWSDVLKISKVELKQFVETDCN